MTFRIYAGLAVVAAVLAAFLYVQHLRADLATQKAKLAAATQQATLNAESAKAVDRVFTTSTVIREKADHAAQQIQAAPHASDPVPADVLAGFVAGVDGLRNREPTAPDRP